MTERVDYRDEPSARAARSQTSRERTPIAIDALTLRYIRAHVLPFTGDREETRDEAPDPDPGPLGITRR